MDEYFVTAGPEPPQREPVTKEQLERLDLGAFHEPLRTPSWLRALLVGGWLMMGLAVLMLFALIAAAVVGVFRFLDSLPW